MARNTETPLLRNFPSIGLLQIAIILLTVITAAMHLYLGTRTGMGGSHPAGPLGAAPAGGFPTGGSHAGGFPGGGPRSGGFPGGGPRSGGFPGRGRSGGGSSIMSMLPLPLPTLFDLNFVGYIALLIALYLPQLKHYQSLLRWALIAYTAVTISMWFLISGGHGDLSAYADKLVEGALIVLLLVEEWQMRRPQPVPRSEQSYETATDLGITDLT